MTAPMLDVSNLQISYHGATGTVHALRGVSVTVDKGETLGIVGESGSGKSVFARAVMGLTNTEAGAQRGGTVVLNDVDLTALSKKALRRQWGGEIGMVFQDPLSSLNPVRTIGSHFRIPLASHAGLNRSDGRRRAAELLDKVGINDPVGCLDLYPHQLSGGMRQRVMIALAICGGPKLLIADEPTTALDVTVQRQVLDLIDELSAAEEMTTLLITHDLSVVAGHADRIMVMYAGHAVEVATIADLFDNPRHPYTEALLGSVPNIQGDRRSRLRTIAGAPPDLRLVDPGCPYRTRCERAEEVCTTTRPDLAPAPGSETLVACHVPLPVGTPPIESARTDGRAS